MRGWKPSHRSNRGSLKRRRENSSPRGRAAESNRAPRPGLIPPPPANGHRRVGAQLRGDRRPPGQALPAASPLPTRRALLGRGPPATAPPPAPAPGSSAESRGTTRGAERPKGNPRPPRGFPPQAQARAAGPAEPTLAPRRRGRPGPQRAGSGRGRRWEGAAGGSTARRQGGGAGGPR